MPEATTNGIGPQDHALIGKAANLPCPPDSQYISVSPVKLSPPGRLAELQMRISAPTAGNELPIILLSHGKGRSNNLSSLNGYAPLAQFYAAHGFVVIQPTHLSSSSLALPEDTPGAPAFWQSRVEDMKYIIDNLDEIEKAVPYIQGRLDHSRIAVVGHSMGTHTAGMLLGLSLTETENGPVENMIEPRVKAGILFAPPGNGGDSITKFAWDNYDFMRNPIWEDMKTQALFVVGDADSIPMLSPRGPDWHTDGYKASPSPKDLLSLSGGHHCLGGISGWDAAESSQEESVEMVAVTQRMTLAYLKSKLYEGDLSWEDAQKALRKIGTLGKVESK